MIEEDGISGVTSNPSIFEKAISSSSDYDEDIRSLLETNRSFDAVFIDVLLDPVMKKSGLDREDGI